MANLVTEDPASKGPPGDTSRPNSHDASDIEKAQPQGATQLGKQPTSPNDEDLYQPGRLRFWLIMLCNFLALFLVGLDRMIIATAVPQITNDFQSLGDIGWYGSAYMLSVAAMQLIFGRVYRLYDTKVTFLASVFFFEVGSIICAAAPSSAAFIVGRAVAGAASAGIFSGFIMIMIPMIPLHRRPMFQSMFGLVFGITGVAGPLIGGAFTSNVSWR
jgi:MFS family permease